jgi:DNA-binding CsgD family transcriptional regulator
MKALMVDLEKPARGKSQVEVVANAMVKSSEKEIVGRKTQLKKFEGVCLLTSRQIQIAKLVLEGFTYPEIARRLFITPRTVRDHKKRIYDILRVKRKKELISRLSQEEVALVQKRFKLAP